MSKVLDTLKNIVGELESIEIEVIPADKEPEKEVATKSTDFNTYFLNEISKNSLSSINLPNQILAFSVYDKFKNVDTTKINSEKLFSDMKKIGQMPIDRKNIEQRVAVVASNATNIACALDNYNPDIIDSMIRMEVTEVAVKENTITDDSHLSIEDKMKNKEYTDTIFKALFKSATVADFNRKIGGDK